MTAGSWVHIEKPECRCADKPRSNISRETHGTGSIWMCACGKQWKLTWYNTQREGDYTQWELVPTPPPMPA